MRQPVLDEIAFRVKEHFSCRENSQIPVINELAFAEAGIVQHIVLLGQLGLDDGGRNFAPVLWPFIFGKACLPQEYLVFFCQFIRQISNELGQRAHELVDAQPVPIVEQVMLCVIGIHGATKLGMCSLHMIALNEGFM